MTTTMTMTTKTARLHAVWVRLAALLALLLALGVLLPQARAQTTSITFFHNDVLGSPAVATDASGAVVWKESYLPYGHRLQAPAAGANNKLWYAGKQLDPTTGLSYMGARYYSPVVGRFMGIDPVEFQEENVHSFNRYAYANNNPYKYVDPDGRHPLLVFAAVGLFMVDFHHAATSNEPFTGVGGSVAPAGAKLAGVFAKSGTSEVGLVAKGVTDPTVAKLAAPAIPEAMTQAQFGKNLIGWGVGPQGAAARTQALTADAVGQMQAQGLTREMATQWRGFYSNEFARNANNLTAQNRVQLMDTILRLMK